MDQNADAGGGASANLLYPPTGDTQEKEGSSPSPPRGWARRPRALRVAGRGHGTIIGSSAGGESLYISRDVL